MVKKNTDLRIKFYFLNLSQRYVEKQKLESLFLLEKILYRA